MSESTGIFNMTGGAGGPSQRLSFVTGPGICDDVIYIPYSAAQKIGQYDNFL
jgi:hypothetical protein